MVVFTESRWTRDRRPVTWNTQWSRCQQKCTSWPRRVPAGRSHDHVMGSHHKLMWCGRKMRPGCVIRSWHDHDIYTNQSNITPHVCSDLVWERSFILNNLSKVMQCIWEPCPSWLWHRISLSFYAVTTSSPSVCKTFEFLEDIFVIKLIKSRMLTRAAVLKLAPILLLTKLVEGMASYI